MHCTRLILAATLAALLPASALAAARVTSVVPVGSGCVTGPSGNSNIKNWDIEKGQQYQITFTGVTDCANGGTDAVINFELKNSVGGNTFWAANLGAPGVYTGIFTLPSGGCETFPVRYCTTDGVANSGIAALAPTGNAVVHMRAATFGAGCSNPQEVLCVTPVQPAAWGSIKAIYR